MVKEEEFKHIRRAANLIQHLESADRQAIKRQPDLVAIIKVLRNDLNNLIYALDHMKEA